MRPFRPAGARDARAVRTPALQGGAVSCPLHGAGGVPILQQCTQRMLRLWPLARAGPHPGRGDARWPDALVRLTRPACGVHHAVPLTGRPPRRLVDPARGQRVRLWTVRRGDVRASQLARQHHGPSPRPAGRRCVQGRCFQPGSSKRCPAGCGPCGGNVRRRDLSARLRPRPSGGDGFHRALRYRPGSGIGRRRAGVSQPRHRGLAGGAGERLLRAPQGARRAHVRRHQARRFDCVASGGAGLHRGRAVSQS